VGIRAGDIALQIQADNNGTTPVKIMSQTSCGRADRTKLMPVR